MVIWNQILWFHAWRRPLRSQINRSIRLPKRFFIVYSQVYGRIHSHSYPYGMQHKNSIIKPKSTTFPESQTIESGGGEWNACLDQCWNRPQLNCLIQLYICSCLLHTTHINYTKFRYYYKTLSTFSYTPYMCGVCTNAHTYETRKQCAIRNVFSVWSQTTQPAHGNQFYNNRTTTVWFRCPSKFIKHNS